MDFGGCSVWLGVYFLSDWIKAFLRGSPSRNRAEKCPATDDETLLLVVGIVVVGIMVVGILVVGILVVGILVVSILVVGILVVGILVGAANLGPTPQNLVLYLLLIWFM